jgi:hypothetical protein
VTQRQLKIALWQVSLTTSKAGEDSQTNRFKDTIKSSDTARSIFQTAEKSNSTNVFQNSNQHNNCINFKKSLILNSQNFRTEQTSKSRKIHSFEIKILVEKLMKQILSIDISYTDKVFAALVVTDAVALRLALPFKLL